MNKTIIFRKIGGIISEITEQYQYLAENPENINPLELELFMANSHFLSDHLAILKKMDESPVLLSENNPVVQLQKEEDPEINRISAVSMHAGPDSDRSSTVHEIIGISEVENKTGNLLKPVETEADVLVNKNGVVEFIPLNGDVKTQANVVEEVENPANSISEIPDIINSVIVEQEIPAVEFPKAEVKEMGNTVADEKIPTLNEVLSAGISRENISVKMNQHENKDLKNMIRLNDKLMFVRDLFNGYSLAYSEAIELVNRFDSFESAENFLKQNYADKNKWAEKQSTVDQFYEILNRRFS